MSEDINASDSSNSVEMEKVGKKPFEVPRMEKLDILMTEAFIGTPGGADLGIYASTP